VGADQNFEAFLREWTNERIWPMGDFLDDGDFKAAGVIFTVGGGTPAGRARLYS